MNADERPSPKMVRTRTGGFIEYHPLEDHGFTLRDIKAWRAGENAAGRPSEVFRFYEAHGLCFDCRASGIKMDGWGPIPPEVEEPFRRKYGLDQFPFSKICETCGGTGKATRSS